MPTKEVTQFDIVTGVDDLNDRLQAGWRFVTHLSSEARSNSFGSWYADRFLVSMTVTI